MSEKLNEDALTALKIAFCYMPKASVARMEYGTTIRQNNHLYKPRVVTQAVRLLNNLTSSPS